MLRLEFSALESTMALSNCLSVSLSTLSPKVSFLSWWRPIPQFNFTNFITVRNSKGPHRRLRLLTVPVPFTVLSPLICMSSGSDSGPDSESEDSETTTSVSSSSYGDSSLAYKICAGIAGIGVIETAYLTYVKLTNSDAFCSVSIGPGPGTCGDILNSDYALVFGIPLPLIGLAAYSLVATLGLQLASNNSLSGFSKSSARLVLLGSTTAMGAASAYFLYILSTKFSGSSCSYCLLSALLSLSLFFITLKEFGLQETQRTAALQLCVTSLVIFTLNTSYTTSTPVLSSLAENELPYYTSEITAPSTPFALSLAKHLQSIGAKMYGAFWCSHCLEQKEMFGREAARILNYVECFPNGFRKGTKMEKACTELGIEGFPTWVINGQVLSGEKELSELAEISGFHESVQPS